MRRSMHSLYDGNHEEQRSIALPCAYSLQTLICLDEQIIALR